MNLPSLSDQGRFQVTIHIPYFRDASPAAREDREYVRSGMIAKGQRILMLAPLLAAACLLAVSAKSALAQGTDDNFFEEDEAFQEEDPFRERDEFGLPVEDFTEGGEFIDESTLPPAEQGVTIGGRQAQLRLLGERQLLPLNAAWGAGTGLLIGGWYALINQGTNRETQRSLGLGIVLGTIVGLVVGVRTLIQPQAPAAMGAFDPPRTDLGGGSLASTSLSASPFSMTFTWRF
jgi:hypothetical protein